MITGYPTPACTGRAAPAASWQPLTVVEIVSAGDETARKPPFYAAHEVQELVTVDPATRTVGWLALAADGEYHPSSAAG